MCWMAANGVLCNLTTANWFIQGFAYISPFRYNCEAYVRIFTNQIPDYDRLTKGIVQINQ